MLNEVLNEWMNGVYICIKFKYAAGKVLNIIEVINSILYTTFLPQHPLMYYFYFKALFTAIYYFHLDVKQVLQTKYTQNETSCILHPPNLLLSSSLFKLMTSVIQVVVSASIVFGFPFPHHLHLINYQVVLFLFPNSFQIQLINHLCSQYLLHSYSKLWILLRLL